LIALLEGYGFLRTVYGKTEQVFRLKQILPPKTFQKEIGIQHIQFRDSSNIEHTEKEWKQLLSVDFIQLFGQRILILRLHILFQVDLKFLIQKDYKR